MKGQNLFEVQAYFFALTHCHDRTGMDEEYLFFYISLPKYVHQQKSQE